jgi:4-carboxymuconolactone decarboxylase
MSSSEGAQRRARAQGAKHESLRTELASFDPVMAEWADDFIFGEIWGREGISQDERMLVAITALAATEHPNQLRNYLHGALQAGLDPYRIQEALKMLVVYVGFPTAIAALDLYREVRAKYEAAS